MDHNEQRPPSQRAPRADARQNRIRILAAAHARFAVDGLAAEMDAIAREAGVAVGTLYHHFGTKEALLEAVVVDGLEHLAAYMQALLAEPDPWTGVERLLQYMAERQMNDRAFGELIGAQPTLRATTTATKRSLGPLIQQILQRAQASGQLRMDVVVGDIPLLLAGLSERTMTPATCQRYLDIVLSGLRVKQTPPAPSGLPLIW
ncbi:MAG: helix-turn-helix domain containing protein [Chloroflexi bacterium]|nr:helix-turn-helix domain containing protein [Chloroflexota bacterium]